MDSKKTDLGEKTPNGTLMQTHLSILPTDVTAHRVTCLERAVRKRFIKTATHKQQPGGVGNLYCNLPVAVVEMTIWLLRVRISNE